MLPTGQKPIHRFLICSVSSPFCVEHLLSVSFLFPIFALATGNFPTVTRLLLAKIPSTDGKMTYVYDDYVFHYVVENSICYLCMSDEKNKHRIPFAFLQDLKQLFLNRYGLDIPQRAIAFSMNEDFSPTIQQRMEYFNSEEADRGIDNIGAVKSQIDEVRDVMVQNIEKVLERGEKIELLVDKTDRLNQQAFRFESSSRALRKAMYWKKMRCYIIVGVISVLLIYVASVALCGFDYHHCKAKK
jgi:vesicle-associated membrane protein 7